MSSFTSKPQSFSRKMHNKRLSTFLLFNPKFTTGFRLRKLFLIYLVLFFTASNILDLADAAEETSRLASSEEGGKSEFHGQYDDIGGDFKKPGPFFHRFTTVKTFGFLHGFIAAISVIIVSELGDKTFFIAAILAMRHSRMTVFLGAISALTVMTILSACLGFATTVIPRTYTHYISTALFAIFGLKMLHEGYTMSPNEGQDEYEEVQKSLSKRESESECTLKEDLETGIIKNKSSHAKTIKRKLMLFVSRIFLESFTMTFLAEWGDRSQLTTIILAAREDAIGVTIGAVLGHAMCTALAVIGGRIIAQRISVRSVTLIGAIVFLIFAVSALVIGPGS